MAWIQQNVCKTDSIVDIGSGNGKFLSSLLDLGFTNLCGLDYSEKAIQMSTAWCDPRIKFRIFDLLTDNSSDTKYQWVLDKGTWDAISLNPAETKQKLALKYQQSLKRLSCENAKLIITSCNWTRSELESIFTDFNVIEEIKHQSFVFGGKTGQVVTTLIIKI